MFDSVLGDMTCVPRCARSKSKRAKGVLQLGFIQQECAEFAVCASVSGS